MKLADKVALITGGARVGATVAGELARRGCRLVLTYRRSSAPARDTADRIARAGGEAVAIRCDVASEPDVKRAVKAAAAVFGRLDVVVNLASIYERTPFAALTTAQWEESLAANLAGAHFVVRHAAPFLRKRGGRVVNVADWLAASGRPGYRDYLPYYTAKRGLIGLTEAQALELAPSVLVNAVAPGPILPPNDMSRAERRAVARATPLGRWGGAAEIARAVVFLCETDFVTGECLRVDGGRHLL